VLFLAYPRSDYDEPDGALASYVEVLSAYPDSLVTHVTNNKTGIQRHLKFPPRIAELVAFCDEYLAYEQRLNRYKKWGETDPALMLEAPREDRPTPAELREKYGKNWGLTSIDQKSAHQPKAPSWDEIAAAYQADPGRLARLLNAKDQ
jgi:hypothetical protein